LRVSEGLFEKITFGPNKAPKKLHDRKTFKFWYFLSLEALSNSSKVQISQKRKIIPRKAQKKGF
jgi:hypothetical protein